MPFDLFAPKEFWIIGVSHLLNKNVHDEGYSISTYQRAFFNDSSNL